MNKENSENFAPFFPLLPNGSNILVNMVENFENGKSLWIVHVKSCVQALVKRYECVRDLSKCVFIFSHLIKVQVVWVLVGQSHQGGENSTMCNVCCLDR